MNTNTEYETMHRALLDASKEYGTLGTRLLDKLTRTALEVHKQLTPKWSGVDLASGPDHHGEIVHGTFTTPPGDDTVAAAPEAQAEATAALEAARGPGIGWIKQILQGRKQPK